MKRGHGMPELVDTVISLKQQGYTNNQIIQYLQGQGFESYQIFDAISQAEAQSKPTVPEMPRFQAEPSFTPTTASQPELEEVVESVVEEKWKTFEEGVKKILEWKNDADARLLKLETEIAGLKEAFSQMQGALFGKLSDYEKGIMDVGSELKAMERVFQKVVPTLTESVAELSRITKTTKEKKA
ncbi:hypothetical protein HY639_00980 [Candidatus Woesearchaeota archaeon]|nr:hypothetical protein [Candidatus Woesearchaeota archaeon]